MTNRFKGPDLIESLKNYGRRFVTLYRSSDQDHPQEKEMQRGKMVVWGGLRNSWEMMRSERQRRKGKLYPFECRVPKIARGDKKAFLSDQCKEIKENNRMGKTRDLLGVSLVHMLILPFYLFHDDAHNLGVQNSKFCHTRVWQIILKEPIKIMAGDQSYTISLFWPFFNLLICSS